MVTYRRDIDGLRALAVLPVIAFHAAPSLLSVEQLSVTHTRLGVATDRSMSAAE